MNRPTHHHDPDADPTDGDFPARLRQRLQSTPIDLPAAPGPHAASDRAHQRTRRRRTTMVAAASIALVGGLAAPSLLDDGNDQGVDTNVAAPIDADGVDLDWQVHDDGLTPVQSADEGSAGFYALSTGPGTRWQDYPDGDAPRALYRWADGAWEPMELDGADPRIARVSERDGTLYALSTAADTGAPVGSVSTDDGESWTQVPLGDLEPPSDDVAWTMSVGLQLASTADTTIGVIGVRFTPPGEDLFDELRDGNEESYQYYWRTSEAGVELIHYTEEGEAADSGVHLDEEALASTMPPDGDPESADRAEAEREAIIAEVEGSETVVRTVPWSDLGVSGIADTSRVATYRADGDTWTPISDGPAPGVGSGDLVSTDSGFLIQTWGGESGSEPSSNVFHSTDGAEWRAVSTPSGDRQTVLAPDGSLLSVAGIGDSLDDSTVSVSTDLGATWSPIDLSTVAPDVAGAEEVSIVPSGGPLGVALVVHNFDGEDSTSRLLFSTDLQSWTVTDLDALLPEDTPHFAGVLIGTDHIVVQAAGPSDPDDAEPGPSSTLVATPVR